MPGMMESLPTAVVFASPSSVTVGVASALALAGNKKRGALFVKNISTGGQRICLAFGAAAAVLNKGIVLDVGEGFNLDRGSMTTQDVLAIADAAAAELAIQEGDLL